jgi:hypothetical protein
MGLQFDGNGGPITFSEIQEEFGGTGPISISEYYRNGVYVTDNNINIPDSGQITLSNFYGASKKLVVPISSNSTNVQAATLLSAAGWNSASFFEIVINSGITVYSTATTSAGLTIDGSYPYGFKVINNGVIMGKGGAGGNRSVLNGEDGGAALKTYNSYTDSYMTVINNTSATIAGGGGGGGGMPNAGGEIYGGGGGGAGGGAGGQAYQERGDFNLGSPGAGGILGAIGQAGTGNGSGAPTGDGSGGGGGSYTQDGISPTRHGGSSGAGGGRILPGVGGIGGDGERNGGSGGTAGAAGAAGQTYIPVTSETGAGGGGGWGAAGGNSITSSFTSYGGAGGPAINKSGTIVIVNNLGTIYGAIVD